MGAPVRINELAERLVAHAERPTKVVYTGLRPGEKLHETLLGSTEIDHRPVHPLISHVAVPPLSRGELTVLLERLEDDQGVITQTLRQLCDGRADALES
jgi:FlaA1/EpsC-like NDP-sugar epimerase